MKISRWLRLTAFSAATVVGASLLSASAQAWNDEPIPITSEVRCKTETGTWLVNYWLGNSTPAELAILSATDTTTGTPVPTRFTSLPSGEGWNILLAQREIPASATSVGLTLVVKRADRAQTQTITRVHQLAGGCAVLTQEQGCVSLSQARYKHTFDGTKGTATIELVGKPLCPGLVQEFDIVAMPEGILFGGEWTYAEMTSQISKISLVAHLPKCKARIAAYIANAGGSGGPWNDNLLGAPGSPGNRSTGPLAVYTNANRPCQAKATQRTTVACDGSIHSTITNGIDSNHPATIQFTEAYDEDGQHIGAFLRSYSLEPGEKATVTMMPRYLPTVDGRISVWINGDFVYQAYALPVYCPRAAPTSGDGTPIGPPRRW